MSRVLDLPGGYRLMEKGAWCGIVRRDGSLVRVLTDDGTYACALAPKPRGMTPSWWLVRTADTLASMAAHDSVYGDEAEL